MRRRLGPVRVAFIVLAVVVGVMDTAAKTMGCDAPFPSCYTRAK